MAINTRNDKELLSGLLFVGTGCTAIWVARSYPIYSDQNLGPGAFPILLGAILALIGSAQLVFGLASKVREAVEFDDLRPLILLSLGTVAFGLIISRGGLLLAVLCLVLASALATQRFRVIETALIFIVLAMLSSAIFVFGLGTPPSDLFPH